MGYAMTAQQSLDFTRYPERAGYKADGTSQEAARAIEGSGRAARLRIAVLGFYARQSGTADECAAALDESPFSIRPRCSELVKQGRLVRTGERRKSSEGCASAVLALAPASEVAA
jgi:hypothetical protein